MGTQPETVHINRSRVYILQNSTMLLDESRQPQRIMLSQGIRRRPWSALEVSEVNFSTRAAGLTNL